jgi:RNA polymerase sigma-70 factor, ECF subfamily
LKTNPLLNEEYLIKKMRDGDEDAIVCIFNHYYKVLVLYAQNIVGTLDIAEEIVQGIFTKLWIDRKYICIETSVRAYLIRAVRNKCLDYFKHEKIKTKYLNKFQQEMLNVTKEDENILITNDLSEHIFKSIEELPEKCREIFKMNRFENKKYNQIAEELGISPKTVEAQITKALKRLREQLRDYL